MGKLIKILSIDGGGVRAIIPGMVLAEIEKRTGKPASKLFDLIAGTSTGAALALGITTPTKDGKPQYRAEDFVNFFEKESPHIFSRPTSYKLKSLGSMLGQKYPSGGVKEVTKKYWGDISIKDSLTELLIPSFELESNSPFFFKRRDARISVYKDFLMREVILATSAAPSFFEPFTVEPTHDPLIKHLSFIDGGVYANNPALCAYVEAKEIFPHASGYLIVSLGTGQFSGKILYERVKRWGLTHWIRPIFDIVISAVSDAVDHQLQALVSAKGDQLKYYYRFQANIPEEDAPMDDASKVHLHTLKLEASDLIRKSDDMLNKLCKKLTA